MNKVAICGGSGYTGIELLRILARHRHVRVSAITSERSAGKELSDVFPHLRGHDGLKFEPLNKERLIDKADIFFLALPHGASQEAVNFFFRNGKKVIDLSADYRLHDRETYERWYGLPHDFASTLRKAVYGLPEFYRKKIKRASLVANPGCYPTSAVLGLMPAVKNGLIDASSIVIDSKSGTSGAGRRADLSVSYCEVNEAFKAYGIGTHRHTPEIEQEISLLARKPVTVNFTPHLLPVDRGILTTIYAPLAAGVSSEKITKAFRDAYGKEKFVRVMNNGTFPNVKNVRGTNYCDIGVKVVDRTDTLIIVSAIDNLVKGASGQAVQNMNIMMGFAETEALEDTALFP